MTLSSSNMSDMEKTISPELAPMDKKAVNASEDDKALAFLREQHATGTVVEINEKALLRKIDYMIVP